MIAEPLALSSSTTRVPLVPSGPASLWLTQAEIAAWQADLDARVQTVLAHPEQNLGFLEEHLHQATRSLQRQALQRMLQAKADAAPCRCPKCQKQLTDRQRLKRTFQSRYGPLTFTRWYGWCAKCRAWHFPADHALGLGPTSTASPFLQEMAALLVSKMPAAQAEPVAERLGVPMSRATLDREARRQGQNAQAARAEFTAELDTWEKLQQVAAAQAEGAAAAPFTLVLEIDAWNIRERDDWGRTAALRKKGLAPQRWHWVYVGTCFRLDHRGTTAGDRALITQRGYVATGLSLEDFLRQLYREAVARGLGQAAQVLVIADGAVWIWNAVADRFPTARQRLDLFHADQHLWAVAHELYGAGTPEAREFVTPLLQQIRDDQAVQVIDQLTQLQPRLTAAQQEAVEKQVHYLQNHQARLRYKAVLDAQKKERRARKKDPAAPADPTAQEPLGSGAIESTCRQYQCRFKRTGQFWTPVGDEALMCVETFWRNGRWEQLYPHSKLTAAALN